MNALPVQQLGDGSPLGYIFNLLYLLLFVFFMLYGQKLQVWTMLREIGSAMNELKRFRDDAQNVAVSVVREADKTAADPTPRINQYLEYFTTIPIDIDPSGIVPKIEHILDVRDQRLKDEVKLLAPSADTTQIEDLEGVLEVALALNYIYRVVKHYYLLGKKMMSYMVIMQIQMQLPLIMQEAKAYSNAVRAFAYGQPIGDGAGALVAAKMMQGTKSEEVAKDIVAAEVPVEGRRAFILKARGPGANIGKYGDAVQNIIKKCRKKVAMVIMIDAALKYEGEKTGDTAEGVGTAIGGIGVDRFKIEETATKFKLPLNAVIIKESVEESVAPMTKEIVDGVQTAIARIKRLINERTKKDDIIIVVGVGNTVGIGQ